MKLGKVSRPCFALSCVAPVQAIRGLGSRSCRSTLAFQSLTASKNRRRDFLNRFSSSLDMTTGLIDVDCNLWHKDLKTLQNKELNVPDTWNILKEDAIEASKIVSVLSPSSTIKEAENGLKTLRNNPPPLPVRTTVGVHPYHVNDDEFVGKSLEEHRDYIKELIETHSDFCAAVGECGLDTSDGFPPLEDQLPWFRLQVRIAEDLDLPLFIHERLAFDETMDILKDTTVPVIIHCFTGTKDQCIEYIKRGYFVSVSGYILKESNDNYAEVISCLTDGVIPMDKLMIETDAPYMGFKNCRKLYVDHNEEFVSTLNSKKRKRLMNSIYPNVPSSLPMVLDRVLECLQQNDASLTREQVAAKTTENAKQFFGF